MGWVATKTVSTLSSALPAKFAWMRSSAICEGCQDFVNNDDKRLILVLDDDDIIAMFEFAAAHERKKIDELLEERVKQILT